MLTQEVGFFFERFIFTKTNSKILNIGMDVEYNLKKTHSGFTYCG